MFQGSSEDMAIFKQCTCCHKIWDTREIFLSDPNIKIIGYKADFETLDLGMFFFNHLIAECCSTITIYVKQFKELYSGKYYGINKRGTNDCHGFCNSIENLNKCDVFCECVFVREIIQIIKEYPK
jgi:hypothetical protein